MQDVLDADAVLARGVEEITSLGSLYLVVVYVVVLAVIGERKTSMILAATAAINSAVVFGVKLVFSRPRPEGGEMFLTSAFPSGHAATAFMVAAVLGQRYPRLRPLLLFLAAVVAGSRVFIDAHFVSDVVAGAVIGYTVGLGSTVWLEGRIDGS